MNYFIVLICFVLSIFASVFSYDVSFDGRSFIINGKRELIIGGSIHYPRAPRSEWPKIFEEAKNNGINLIQTYVFWDVHEPEKDVFYFPTSSSTSLDFVAFCQEAAKAGLYVHLRIAGYVCAEWNFGGIPSWLRNLNCIFRTDDDIWLQQLKEFVIATVDVIRDAKLLAADDGPIVMLQIENEYGNVEYAYGDRGSKYVQWLSALTRSIDVGNIPWIMCQQGEGVGTAPPADIINSCNGYYCDNWISSHVSSFPNQPHMFTENWPGWFQKWGEATPHRPAVDVAFSVARWFARGGTYMNYYMAFGGTSFGRSAGGPMIVTSYDYDVQINEYSMHAEPKYSLLQQLHTVLLENSEILLSQLPPVALPLEGYSNCESHTYRLLDDVTVCIAFLSNYNTDGSCPFDTVTVPAWSVSILTGRNCTQHTYNTKATAATIASNELLATAVTDFKLRTVHSYSEPIPATSTNSSTSSLYPLEQLSLTQDSTDYLWYSTSIPYAALTPCNTNTAVTCAYSATVEFTSALAGGGLYYIYINKHRMQIPKSVTSAYGPLLVAASDAVSVMLEIPADLVHKHADLTLDILSLSMGLQNYGTFLERVTVGILSNVTVNKVLLTHYMHTVGLTGEHNNFIQNSEKINSPGEKNKINTNENENPGKNSGICNSLNSLCWTKLAFRTPAGVSEGNALALDMAEAGGKGAVWVNGNMLGRYWNITGDSYGDCTPTICDSDVYTGAYSDKRCRTGCDQPSQRYYKLPTDWLFSSTSGLENSLVLFEEISGNPDAIRLVSMSMQDI